MTGFFHESISQLHPYVLLFIRWQNDSSSPGHPWVLWVGKRSSVTVHKSRVTRRWSLTRVFNLNRSNVGFTLLGVKFNGK